MSSEIQYVDSTDYIGSNANRFTQYTSTRYINDDVMWFIGVLEDVDLQEHKQTDYYKWCKRKVGDV